MRQTEAAISGSWACFNPLRIGAIPQIGWFLVSGSAPDVSFNPLRIGAIPQMIIPMSTSQLGSRVSIPSESGLFLRFYMNGQPISL